MKELSLSKRMEAVVNMVSPQSFAIADIGCDHAYVSIALRQRRMAQKVIAMDVRKGPLAIAKNNVMQYGLEDTITLRLSDGLEQLQPNEVDTIIIAGMGGLLMMRILEEGRSVWKEAGKCPAFILQPQSDIDKVRHYLYENGYFIERECMLIDEGKYYTVISAKPGKKDGTCMPPEGWIYGMYNLEHRDVVLQQFLEKERNTLQQIQKNLTDVIAKATQNEQEVPDKTKLRMEEVEEQLSMNTAAREYYDVRVESR